jgi:hypothetical protein
MSEYDDDDYTDGTDLVKKLRAKIDELSKSAKELQAENDALKASERKRSVATVLESRGYNPKIAAFIPADLDPTEENLSEWLSEYGDVFGGASPEQEDNQPARIVNDAAQADAIRRMGAAESGSMPSIQASNDVLAAIAEAKNMDELMGILNGG